MLAAEASAAREDGPAVARDDASLRQRNDSSSDQSNLHHVPSDASPAQDSQPHDEQENTSQLEPLASNPPSRASPSERDDQCPPPADLQRRPSASSSSSMKFRKAKKSGAPPASQQPQEDGAGAGADDANMAIGPAQDEIKAAPGGPDADPVCNLTLLLAAGGRHPYKIDAKYLGRRHVKVPDVDKDGHPDPFSISVYTLKELILREWRADWEAKPASPSSIRLIYFGKLLDDKNQLKAYQFSAENPNVVHMSIRPQDLDDEEPKTGNKSLPTAQGTGAGSRDGRCCVIL